MKIYKKDDKIIVELNYWQKIFNIYGDDKEIGEIKNLIGVICGDEQGLAQLIDMTYKGKEPQIGGIIVNTCLEDKEFKKLCKNLEIDFYEYPICAYCQKPLFGSFTIGNKGDMCFNCKGSYWRI